jgi:hypothetical protein
MITRMAREREGQNCRWIDRKGYICLDRALGWDGVDVVHWVELVGVGGLHDFVATQYKQNEEYYIHGVVREIIEMPVL